MQVIREILVMNFSPSTSIRSGDRTKKKRGKEIWGGDLAGRICSLVSPVPRDFKTDYFQTSLKKNRSRAVAGSLEPYIPPYQPVMND